jgi:hypoxanthine phosphoribosyltransferase
MNEILSFFIGFMSSFMAGAFTVYLVRFRNKRFSFKRIMKEVSYLHSKIENDGYKPDIIITIDRNGAIIGSILSGFLGLKSIISIATINKRNSEGKRTIKISEDHFINLEIIRDKNVLIFIGFNSSGTALETVYSYIKSSDHKAKKIMTASLYTTVSPKFKPKYFSQQVGEKNKQSIIEVLSKMPWMTEKWIHVMGNERFKS